MQKAIVIFSSLIILLAGLYGCRKHSHSTVIKPAKYTGCRISQITQYGYDSANTKIVYNFDYNDDGSVSKITIPAQQNDVMVSTFTYKTNCIIVYTTDNTLAYSKDSLLLDGNNHVTFIDHYNYNGSPQPNQMWDKYQYDSLGNMVYHTYHSYSTNTTSSYSWKNGDLQWNTSGTDVVDYYYDTNLYNVGNITSGITDFVSYGRSINGSSRHLHTYSIADGNDTATYTYQLDNMGKVTRLYASTSLTPITYITYTCE